MGDEDYLVDRSRNKNEVYLAPIYELNGVGERGGWESEGRA